MFDYHEGLSKYIEMRRNKVVKNNTEIADRIKILQGKFGGTPLFDDLTKSILEAAERCVNEINERPESTLSLISNLRFLFETSVSVRLLNLEPQHKYRIRYSIYKHQLEKSQSLTRYASVDKARLDTLIIEEHAIERAYEGKQDFKNEFKDIDKLYDNLDCEISIFLDSTEQFGAEYQQEIIDNFLESHQLREAEIHREWEAVKKSLLDDTEACALFDFRGQISKVEKELSDKRSWKEKAAVVGLGSMYEFIYDYTSSLLHSTSYAILTPHRLDEAEIYMILSLSTRIANDIYKGLQIFGRIPDMRTFHVE
ncbi:hypothetical protein BK673_13150 [Pseudomonas fluorescens]|jgi:hypothetical protein|uniref:Uncharacterized protein n=1 Tax=Pseudomonas fluorescens TaxID=294 RepID=A0A423P6F0_PSEFL|nr:hypothetical protein [Pseudomonas fluorescens]ROO09848.1 hypothetical protein BK673_13150 [Pseudomonas fluorescens]